MSHNNTVPEKKDYLKEIEEMKELSRKAADMNTILLRYLSEKSGIPFDRPTTSDTTSSWDL